MFSLFLYLLKIFGAQHYCISKNWKILKITYFRTIGSYFMGIFSSSLVISLLIIFLNAPIRAISIFYLILFILIFFHRSNQQQTIAKASKILAKRSKTQQRQQKVEINRKLQKWQKTVGNSRKSIELAVFRPL